MSVDNVVRIITQHLDLASPGLAKVGENAERLTNRINTAGIGAAQGFDPATKGIERVGTQAATTLRQVQRLSDEIRKPGTLSPTIPIGRTDEFDRRIRELQALSASISTKLLSPQGLTSMFRDIAGAQTFKDIDRLGERITFLTSKTELLGRLGSRGFAQFRQQIVAATTTRELERIEADIQRLGIKAQGTGGALQGLGQRLREALQGATGIDLTSGLAGGLLGGAVVAGVQLGIQALQQLGRHLKQAVDDVNQLAISQRRLHVEGIETGQSVQQLETLDVAAKLTGVEIQQLQFASKQLAQKMVDQPQAFAAAGIAVKDAAGHYRSVGAVMRDLSVLMHSANDSTLELTASSSLLGRSGTRLLPVMAAGAQAFDEWTRFGRQVGVVLDDLSDRALVNLANQVSRNDLIWQGFKTRLSVAVAPAFQAVASGMESMLMQANSLAANVQALSLAFTEGQNKIADWVASLGTAGARLRFIVDNVSQLYPMLGPLNLLLGGIRQPGAGAENMLAAHHTGAQEANEALAKMIAILRGNKSEADKFNERVGKLVESLKMISPEAARIDELALSFRGSRIEVEALAKSFDDGVVKKISERAPLIQAAAAAFGAEWRGVVSVLGNAGEKFSEIPKKIEAIKIALAGASSDTRLQIIAANVTSAFDRGAITLKEYKALLDALGGGLDSMLSLVGKITAGSMLIKAPWDNVNTSVHNTVADALSLELLVTRIGVEAAKIKPINIVPPKAKFDTQPAPQSVPEPLPQDKRRIPGVSSGEMGDIQSFLAETIKSASDISDAFEQAFGKMTQGLDQFFGRFLDRLFATKSAWGQFWRAMVDVAIRELERILLSKAFLAVFNLIMTFAGVGAAPKGGAVVGGGFTGGPVPHFEKAQAAPPGARPGTAAPATASRPIQVNIPEVVTPRISFAISRPAPTRANPFQQFADQVKRAMAPSQDFQLPRLSAARRRIPVDDGPREGFAGLEYAKRNNQGLERAQPSTPAFGGVGSGSRPNDEGGTKNYYISTIESRSILDQLLGPRGEWRRSESRIGDIATANGD